MQIIIINKISGAFAMENKSRLNQERLATVLAKNCEQRTHEQAHYLSVSFKNIIRIGSVVDWWMINHCIQHLELVQYEQGAMVSAQELAWIYVIEGSCQNHGLIYYSGENLSIDANEKSWLTFSSRSKSAVLSADNLLKAQTDSDNRIIEQHKHNAKEIIFGQQKMTTKTFNIFWEQITVKKVKKNKRLLIQPHADFIFFVITGSLVIRSKSIKIVQISHGSIFSTYLGCYVRQIYPEFLNSHSKYEFEYFGCEDGLILGFNPDIFYENERFHDFRFVINNAWKLYEERVRKLEIIIQKLGIAKPQKKKIIKNIKEESEIRELKQRAISVPTIIQQHKLHKIVENFFVGRSTRRKVPNIASQLARSIICVGNSSFTENTPKKSFSEPKLDRPFKLKKHRANTEQIASTRLLRTQNINSKSILFTHRDTESTRLTDNPEEKESYQIGNFFKPSEFLSRKLKLDYENVCQKLNKLKLPLSNTNQISKSIKTTNRKNLQEYINERRIVKLGPKKKLLYKRKIGL